MLTSLVRMASRFVTPPTRHRQKGSFLAIFQYGGRERGISPPTGRETGLPPEVTGYHPPTMQAMATGANRKPLQTLFWVRTVAKRRARASRIGHGEEGPLLPRGWPLRDRQIGDGRKRSNGGASSSRGGKRPTRERQHWRGLDAVSPPETGTSADVSAARCRGCEPRSHP